MSDNPPIIGGSGYGLGAYGMGPYAYATRIFGALAATRMRVRPRVTAQAGISIVSAAAVTFRAEQLWAAIAIPACQPWPAIGRPGCWQTIPNSAGAMFPGLE